MAKSKVALASCPDYQRSAVERAVEQVLEPFGGMSGVSGFGRTISKGDRVLVKPNFLRAAPAEAAVSPHPEVVRAVCRRLLELGANIRIGDSPAFGTAQSAARACGVLEIAQEFGIPVVEFKQAQKVVTDGRVRLSLQLDREVLEADAVVNLCKFKGHQQLGMTLAVKNLFGCITGKRKPVWHLRLGDRGNGFGEMLVEVYRHVAPSVSICDGILAMEGDGPGRGTPRHLGLMMAAEDAVALDTIGALIVDYPLEELRVYQAARDLEVGSWLPSDIEVVGNATFDELCVTDWKRPDSLPIFFNPARVAWSTAKQAVLLAQMRGSGQR